MERQIRRLGIALVRCSRALRPARVRPGLRGRRDREQPRERSRQLIAEYNVQRGKILTADGTRAGGERADRRRARLPVRAPVPAGRPLRHLTGYYSQDLRPLRARAVDEHLPLRRRARARDLEVHRSLPRPAEARRERLHHDRSEPAGRGAHGAREQRGRGRRDGPAHRRHPGPVLEPGVRPERALPGERRRDATRVEAAERRPDKPLAVARVPGTLPARLEFQDRDGVGRARERLRPGQRLAEPAPARPARSRTRSSRTSATSTATAAHRPSRWPRRSRSRAT